MFIKKIGTKKSALISANNSILRIIQNTKFCATIRESVFFKYIDILLYALLILTLVSCAISTSGLIGVLAICFSVLTIIKIFVKKGARIKISLFDKGILCYFIFVTMSLFASTNFNLSLMGYIKTFTYILFYMCISHYFQDNKNKILPTFLIISGLISFESIIAIIQNHAGVLAISGWQDTSNLDPTQVISRAYGTLQPYNPNLLAGYLIAGMSSLWCLTVINFFQKNYKRFFIFLGFLLTSIIAVIYSGSRGGYLGLIMFFALVTISFYYYIQNYTGGFKSIKKRFKNLVLTIICAGLVFITTNPAITARIASIFAFRGDSSISFRMNVYASSFQMFLDNPFLGIGVGNKNFREVYGLYMKSGYDALGSYSVPLEIAVESGIFALVSFITFLALWIKDCIKTIQNSDLTNKIIIFSLVISVLMTMTHGLFDTIWFRPQVQILFWLNIAFLNALKN